MTDGDEPSSEDERILDEIRQLRDDLVSDDELVSTDPAEAYELWINQLG